MRARSWEENRLRAMYPSGRANATARRYAAVWSVLFGLGLAPKRWVTLEVPGRRSGRTVRFPLGMADWQGHWYLVPMLGADCNWVQNVRAANGHVTLRHRRGRPCQLFEVPIDQRPPILRRYLQKVPGARPHMPIDRDAPLADFEALAPSYPVFGVLWPDRETSPAPRPSRPRKQDG